MTRSIQVACSFLELVGIFNSTIFLWPLPLWYHQPLGVDNPKSMVLKLRYPPRLQQLFELIYLLDVAFFYWFIERANSLKRLSKAWLILGDTVKSADLAFSALQGYKDTYENTMEHREVTNYQTCQTLITEAKDKLIESLQWNTPCYCEKHSPKVWVNYVREHLPLLWQLFSSRWQRLDLSISRVFALVVLSSQHLWFDSSKTITLYISFSTTMVNTYWHNRLQ